VLDAQEPVKQAYQGVQDSQRMQDAVQAPPTGLSGLISSPIFQLAAPTALSALAAMFPRTMGPAAGIGMAGFRSVTDMNAANIQQKRTSVAEQVKQRLKDLSTQKLKYGADQIDMDPAKRQAIDLQANEDPQAAAASLVNEADLARKRTEAGLKVEAPGVEKPVDQGLSQGLDDYSQAYPIQPPESREAWVQKLMAKQQQDKLAQAEKMRSINTTPDPAKAKAAEDRVEFINLAADNLWQAQKTGNWKQLLDMSKLSSQRNGGNGVLNNKEAVYVAAEKMARAEGGHIDYAAIRPKLDMVNDYTNGPTSRNIVSLNTAIAHIGGVYDAMKNVEILDSPVGNQALQRYWETVDSSPEFQRYLTSLSGPKKEVAGFLLNNRALYESDRQEFDRLASTHVSSGAMAEVLKEWIHLSDVRATELNNKWKHLFGTDYEDLYSSEAEDAAQKVGSPVVEPSMRKKAAPGGEQPKSKSGRPIKKNAQGEWVYAD
jgi:hypothetical protein